MLMVLFACDVNVISSPAGLSIFSITDEPDEGDTNNYVTLSLKCTRQSQKAGPFIQQVGLKYIP